jgi:hypothetical protein
MLGPLRDLATGELVVIGRREAADTGRTFFYTGKPCKHGHMSPRYVTNAGCVTCITKSYKPRINPWSTRLVPFSNAHLWTAAHLSKMQRVALRVYLQHCIFEFVRVQVANDPVTFKVELEAAMQEIEDRGRFATHLDPRSTD